MSLARRGGEKLTSYIRYRSDENNYSRLLWPANHVDRYIYVSFSLSQFLKAYGSYEEVQLLGSTMNLAELDNVIASKFKDIIEHSWIGQANLPIKFLPSDASMESIKSKNICFMVSDELLKTGYGYTCVLSSTYLSRVRLAFFPLLTPETLTQQDIYIFLHESAHALIECKHFRFYDETDFPPYVVGMQGQAELDCTKTVMAYTEDCSPVMKSPITTYIYDEKGVFLREHVGFDSSQYPTKLGLIDLEAAAEFKASWHARNEEEYEKFMAFLVESDEGDEACYQSNISDQNLYFTDFVSESSACYRISFLQYIADYVMSCISSTMTLTNDSEDEEMLAIQSVHAKALIQLNLPTKNVPSVSWIDKGLKWAANELSECESYFPPADSLAHGRYWQHSVSLKHSTSTLFASSKSIPSLTTTPTSSLPRIG